MAFNYERMYCMVNFRITIPWNSGSSTQYFMELTFVFGLCYRYNKSLRNQTQPNYFSRSLYIRKGITGDF